MPMSKLAPDRLEPHTSHETHAETEVTGTLVYLSLLLGTAQAKGALNGKQAALWVHWLTRSAVLTG